MKQGGPILGVLVVLATGWFAVFKRHRAFAIDKKSNPSQILAATQVQLLGDIFHQYERFRTQTFEEEAGTEEEAWSGLSDAENHAWRKIAAESLRNVNDRTAREAPGAVTGAADVTRFFGEGANAFIIMVRFCDRFRRRVRRIRLLLNMASIQLAALVLLWPASVAVYSATILVPFNHAWIYVPTGVALVGFVTTVTAWHLHLAWCEEDLNHPPSGEGALA